MLMALMGGQAFTATELATVARISKQTASSHLKKLVDAALLSVQRQGRHSYYQLAAPDVADLMERLMGVAERAGAVRLLPGPRDTGLRKARVCYDHLAGDLAVRMLDQLLWQDRVEQSVNKQGDSELLLTTAGELYFRQLGLPVDALQQDRRPVCRACLDWSVRRHHLAGSLGAAILQICFRKRWARREQGSRLVRFTSRGEQQFLNTFCGEIA